MITHEDYNVLVEAINHFSEVLDEECNQKDGNSLAYTQTTYLRDRFRGIVLSEIILEKDL